MVERTIERRPGVVGLGVLMEPPYWQLQDPVAPAPGSRHLRPELRTFYLVEYVAGPDGRGVVMSGRVRSIEPASHWVLAQVLGVPYRADCSKIIADKDGAKVRDSLLVQVTGTLRVCPGCHAAASAALERVRRNESTNAAGHGLASGAAVSAGADGGAPAAAVGNDEACDVLEARGVCPFCANDPCVCDLGAS